MIITKHAAKHGLQRSTKKSQIVTAVLLLVSLSTGAWAADNGSERSESVFYRVQYSAMRNIDAYISINAEHWPHFPTSATELLQKLNDPKNKDNYHFTHLYENHPRNLKINRLENVGCSPLTVLEQYQPGACPGQILVELASKRHRIYGTDAHGHLLTRQGQVLSYPDLAQPSGLLQEAYAGILQPMPWNLPLLNQTDRLGRSSLWWASLSHSPSQQHSVQQLRRAGAHLTSNPWIQVPETVLAAASGDLEWLQTSIGDIPDQQWLEKTGNDGYTPLMAAAEHGHLDIVKDLLARGADVQAMSYREYRALDLAAEQGHQPVINALLQAGAKPTDTTWIVAAGQGRLETLKQLKSPSRQLQPLFIHGGLFAQLEYAEGALEAAAKGGHLASVKWLLEQGVVVPGAHATDKDDNNALMLAAAGGHLEVLDLLLQQLPQYRTDHLLQEAVQYDRLNILQYLQKRRPKEKSFILGQAMIWSITYNAPKCFDYVFNKEQFRDKNALNQALGQAAIKDRQDLLKKLLAAGADINEQADKDTTPLMLSIRNLHPETVKFLLANGANPNIKSQRIGMLPLILAIHTGRQELVRALVEAGADLNLQQTPYTALELAIQKEQTDVVAYLLARGADPNKYAFHAPLLTAVLAKNTQVVKLLLDAGANINVGQGKAVPPPPTRHITGNVIHIAAAMNHQPIVELLLKREKTEQIQAALFAALANDHDTLVDWLLDQNPELNWQNKEGETLLMRVALTGDSKRFNTLIAAGADPLKRTQFGDTALAYAVHAPSLEVFEQLLKLDTNTLSIQQALIQAIVTGQRNVFDRCLSLLNTVNRPDYLGNTPLIYAVIYNRLNWIPDLLTLDANINQSNKWGHTPLMFAVVNKTPPQIDRRDEPHLGLPTAINYGIWSVSRHHPNSDALVPMLIKAGANPNAQDKKYGDTALIKAVAEGNIAGVRQLLASDANLEHRNLSGYSVKEVLLDNIEYDKETEDQEGLKIHMQINEILKAHEQKK